MPIFSCPQCGASVTASHKPSACRQCGGRQIRTNRNNSGSLSGKLTPPRSKGSPSGPAKGKPLPLMESSQDSPPNSLDPPRPERRSNEGLGFNIFSPGLIMTWLLVLLPLASALGYSFYRIATFQLVTTEQDGQSRQENPGGQKSQENGENRPEQPTGMSPEAAIAKYYHDLNQQPDTDGWQWVFRTEIYGTKILKAEPSHTVLQVGLRYHLHNGEKVCESRVFTLTPDKKRQNWQIGDPQAIRAQSRCTL